jgi:hypothetical protein
LLHDGEHGGGIISGKHTFFTSGYNYTTVEYEGFEGKVGSS